MSALAPLPPGYRYEWLARAEVPALIESLRLWYPEIALDAGGRYLREDFYADQVFLRGEAEKDVVVVLVKSGSHLAAVYAWEREHDAIAMCGRLGVVAPPHRGAHLATGAMTLLEAIGRATGAGLLYGMASLKTPHMQLALERSGFRLLGLVPVHDREGSPAEGPKRVFEAIYAKVLVPEQDLQRPDPTHLTPGSRALLETLFPAR